MYYVSFIDDFLRNTWICFLQNKSEVFGKFKEFKVAMENQAQNKIKVLRTYMVDSSMRMNLRNSIRSVVYKGRIILHTNLNIMGL